MDQPKIIYNKDVAEIKNIVVLGASGSIGQQTLDVVRQHSHKLKIVGLAVYSAKDKLDAASQEFDVDQKIAIADFKNPEDAQKAIQKMVTAPNVDVVVNAISGAAGLFASYETLKAGKRVALANKESLVVAGDLLMPMAGDNLLPIDSEHGAIFQCLLGEEKKEVYKIHITASGGPFFGKKPEDLQNITAAEALKHPTWNMGPKITIDSSTLMNKGLEVIEAHHLFDVSYDKINVVVQRQSAIHSMVEYTDGSVKAHMGTTDMRIPIQYALSYPERWDTPVSRMDFQNLGSLDFGKPDCETFKCLKLAFQAGQTGGTMPCVMNAANEVAVKEFLAGNIKFLDIPEIIEATMNNFKAEDVQNLDQLNKIDAQAREFANSLKN